MSKVNYPSSSAYATTPQTSWYLGPINYREVPPNTSDMFISLDSKYHLRPDLLSYDLYNNPAYWWVFMVRNLDQIRDPIWDFTAGLNIFVPTAERIQKLLG